MALFLTLPYGKFAQRFKCGIFRSAALLKFNIEKHAEQAWPWGRVAPRGG
jgi:hypothetical protein